MIPDETLYLPLADLAAGIRARRIDPVELPRRTWTGFSALGRTWAPW